MKLLAGLEEWLGCQPGMGMRRAPVQPPWLVPGHSFNRWYSIMWLSLHMSAAPSQGLHERAGTLDMSITIRVNLGASLSIVCVLQGVIASEEEDVPVSVEETYSGEYESWVTSGGGALS